VGAEIRLGDTPWQVHPAPGHDPHSVILFEPLSRTLVSADALWERGFGVVFLELEDHVGFAAVASTLDLIESLRPAQVIPGHGSVFTDVAQALAVARQRLDSFVSDPARHDRHAAKVLVKFKLLSWQQVERDTLLQWVQATPHVYRLLAKCAPTLETGQALDGLLQDLQKSGALRLQGGMVLND
jgi:glyoxylase-like metal-dependent hydrolase (beta-lactamase superfamily II)